MTSPKPPVHATDIDVTWLTNALRARHPMVDVASVAVQDRAEVTNAHARLVVDYAEADGAPATLFCKLLPTDDRRGAIASTLMGPREVQFYNELAPLLNLRVPQVHVAIHDPADDAFVLLLEDLDASGCRVSDGTWGVDRDGAAQVLEDLAEMHAMFESPQRRADVAWIREPTFGSTYGSTMLQYAMDHHRDRISDDFAAISEHYIGQGRALFEAWTSGPKTVIHGDTHVGNVFFDGDRVGFLDWGIINVNTPMREVSYFMNMAMDIEVRREEQTSLLRHYLGARKALGASEITFDEAWAAHRVHAAYCVPASCQVVTFPEMVSDRRRIFSEAFLARAEAAIADLDALAAIRQTADL